ncbi:MAG: threonylcarbamoyl-AMP synthase [Bryobacterales bacterium]|nr:threonylcarbamoyl-AMP synthase [Bryobacterales bacterium]
MRRFLLSNESGDGDVIAEAARILREGGLVAFPTETVYGLGANALDENAVDRIYRAKNRPAASPLIVHVASVEHASQLAAEWPPHADALASAFWPGPLTLVLPKSEVIPDRVTAGLPTVALRIPSHPVARALLEASGLPIAAPSANLFMGVSPTDAAHVRASLGDAADLILEGGPSEVGLESTVLSLIYAKPAILRLGMIARHQIEAVVGPLDGAGGKETGEGTAHPSPGMHPRHYSPRTPLLIAAGDDPVPSGRVVRLWWKREPEEGQGIQLPSDAAGYARELYRALHLADECRAQYIVVEAPPTGEEWEAIWDRLRRAASR